MNLNDKIFVAGHRGMVGSAIIRKLKSNGYNNIITSSKNLDLRNQSEVHRFMSSSRPDYVFLSAAKVGGIGYNLSNPADFIYDNLMIQSNIIHSSHLNGVKKLMFLGSSCIYPRDCPQPMKEEYLMSSPLEPSNESYSLAKIAGIKMCQSYTDQYGFNTVSVMPTNIYGPNDNFDINKSHVIPAMIVKLLSNTRVEFMGDGSPVRDFLYVDDLADAIVFLMSEWHSPEIINIGSGLGISIKELSKKISNFIGFDGEMVWNTSMPNGTLKKVLDNSKIESLGWKPNTSLDDGLMKTIEWYRKTGGKREL
jgi:GDP-L-fucose synthase